MEIIKNLNLENDRLDLARDWLIIGCYTGQRVSDFFRMSKKMITGGKDGDFIKLTQEKTKTLVKIPIRQEVRNILDKRNGEFPPLYSKNIESSKTTFNIYLKKLCRLANIERTEEGKVWDFEEERYIFKEYPLYDIISSHICRRTFATMFYNAGIKISSIMRVTGHQTEKEFLNYIGEDENDTADFSDILGEV